MCQSCENDPGLAAYYHGCSYCGKIPDEDGECDCPPEDYIRPGSESLLYVNAYEVTRHYGGPEEGGWYYNHHEPVASISVKAVSIEGHTDVCYTCSRAREGVIHPQTGEKYELCKWSYHLDPVDQGQVDAFKAHLESIYGENREGNIYSVLGGMDIMIVVEEHPGERTPRPHYE